MNILVLTYWSYSDALIQAYTLPYVRIIKKYNKGTIWLVTYENNDKRLTTDEYNRITNELGKEGIVPVFLKYHKNLFLSIIVSVTNIFKLLKIIRRNNIKVIHPWCTPAGVMGVILKFLKRDLVLNMDSFEPHAETMVETGTWKATGLKNRILFYFEGLEAKNSSDVICIAPGMDKYASEKYGHSIDAKYLKPACVDLTMFSDKMIKDKELMDKYGLSDKIVCVYAGKFGGMYLEDEAFQFIKQCENYWGKDRFRFLLLSNTPDEYISDMLKKYNIAGNILIKLFVPHSEVARYMGMADFAMCTFKPVPSRRYGSPIKNGEYWALGLPVAITPGISNDSDIIAENNAGAVIETLDEASYTKAIKKIDSIISSQSRAEVYAKIRPLAEKYRNFSIAEDVYKSLYASL